MTLPNELIDYIISFVHDKKTLFKCSLVSHSFLTATRSQLFSYLRLDGLLSAFTFLRICKSPLCTISLARVHKLELLDPGIVGGVLEWVARDRTLKSLMGETVKELRIAGMPWPLEFERATERNLCDGFRGVTKLDIHTGNAGDIGKIVDSFPMLQELVLSDIRDHSEAVGNHDGSHICRGPPPKNLCTISINEMDRELFDQLVPYGPTLRRFTCTLGVIDDHESSMLFPAIGSLLREARSLESVTFKAFTMDVRDIESFDNNLTAHINFSCNPCLRHLVLDIQGRFQVIPFLERIASSHNYTTSTPTLESLDIPALESILETPTDWSSFDIVLQKPYFSSLRKITWTHEEYFSPEDFQVSSSQTADIVGFSLADDDSVVITLEGKREPGFPCQGTLVHVSIAEKLQMLKENLPGCYERGLLKPHFECFRFL